MNVYFNSGKAGATRSASSLGLPFVPHPTTPDRVVTLAGLSARLPDRFIAEQLGRALWRETGESVLLVQFEATTEADRCALLDWGDTLARGPKGEFAFSSSVQHVEEGVATLKLYLRGEITEVENLSSVISHVRLHFQYVILHIGSELPVAVLMAGMFQADRTFLLLRPDGESFYHRELLLREIQARPNSDAANLRTIVCREKGEDHCNDLLKEMGQCIHGFVHDCPPTTAAPMQHWAERHFGADVRRLAREIARCRVGLALSSGGARGLAHIGIIQVLEENGIEIDVIAGCSMGSYVGAVWAYGYDGYVMERLAREVEKRWGLLELIDPFILPRQGFLRGEKVKRRLKRSIGDVHFSELVRPLRIVATNLSTLERTVFSRGEVACAVHASSAIPGACIPVRIEDELYIDGGIADPLPVDVLQEMGIEKIIAVNTIPTAAYLRCRYELDRQQAAQKKGFGGRVRASINHYLNYFAPGNILDVILRSFHGAQMRVAEMACLHADLVLRPLSFDGRWHDFRHPGKYIAIGRREAEEQIDAIKALVSRKEPAYELNAPVPTLGTIA